MKKTFLVIMMVVAFVLTTFAGGILTNTNQSAQFVRMLSRNASTQIDAVYFNPAGVMQLENGFHIALHNQTISQTRTILTGAPLNNKEFIGDVKAPLFPSAFAVYKVDNLAFSLGFGPNGGGGSADYKTGLPSFEGMVANKLSDLKPEGYDVDIAFKGQSVFWGLQAGVSAKLGDVFSGYLGVRYLPSKNTYTGHIKDISVVVGGQKILAFDYLTALSSAASGAAASVQPLITMGGGALTIPQAHSLGYIKTGDKDLLLGGLIALGVPAAQANAMNINQVQAVFTDGAAFLDQSAQGTKDVMVDVTATGAGWTPIVGININPSEELNIGLKYEHKTALVLTNETREGDGFSDAGMAFLKNNQKVSSDLPGIVTAGLDYKVTDRFLTSLSFNTYLDKGVDWGSNIYGEKRDIDKNSWELALGLQYHLFDNFALSIGGMQSTTGVSQQYQSDFSYSNTSNTGSFGFQWNISESLTFDAGVLYTVYKDYDKAFKGYKETYDKENFVFGFGLAYSIFK